uniref:Sodium channel modifier 1 acidic C-terminal domain-containing protein n=1 Tax=Ornithorhynchus anatinus TaxID=9258 RepID=A0A6I8PE12_ORNAN
MESTSALPSRGEPATAPPALPTPICHGSHHLLPPPSAEGLRFPPLRGGAAGLSRGGGLHFPERTRPPPPRLWRGGPRARGNRRLRGGGREKRGAHCPTGIVVPALRGRGASEGDEGGEGGRKNYSSRDPLVPLSLPLPSTYGSREGTARAGPPSPARRRNVVQEGGRRLEPAQCAQETASWRPAGQLHSRGRGADVTRRAGCPAPLLAQTRLLTQKALRPAAPYSSCSRRRPDRSAGPAASSVPTALSVPTVTRQAEERPPARGAEPPAPPVGEEQEEDGGVEEGAAAARPPSPGRRRALDHYLKLRSAGWIPDGSGHWVKDANAEFDSDEEEPPLLPPD